MSDENETIVVEETEVVDETITAATVVADAAVANGALVKVNPWGKDQGDFVLIDADTFNPELHTPFGEAPAKATRSRAAA